MSRTRRRASSRPGDASVRPASADPAAWLLVRGAAAHGLAGAPPMTSPSPTDDLAWSRVIRLAEQQRVVGLLAAVVADGSLELTPDQFERLAETHEAWCAHDLRLERTLLRAADALDAAALPFLVIKGPALAHRWYADPAQRLFGDLDLVVPSGRVREASRVLAEVLGTSRAAGAATRVRRAVRQGDAAAQSAQPWVPRRDRARRPPHPGRRRTGAGHPAGGAVRGAG